MRAWVSVLLAVVAAGLFGAATPASKVLLRQLPPFQLAGVLYLGAALGVLPVVVGRRAARWPWQTGRRNRLRLLGAVVCGGVCAPVCLLLGLRLAPAASVSLWLNLELAATAVLGHLLFHDHLGRQGWVGVAGALAAGALLCAGEGIAGLQAGLLVAAACLCWGIDNHLTALIDGMHPAETTLWKGLAAGTVNLVVGVLVQPYAGSLLATSTAVGLGALSYGASITLSITAAQSLGATRGQMIFASAPFWGMALSAGVLGETISPVQLIAAAVLAGSLALVFRDQHGHAHDHDAIAHTHAHQHDDDHHDHAHPEEATPPRHAHWHEHVPLSHVHPHWPDLHHRHRHTTD